VPLIPATTTLLFRFKLIVVKQTQNILPFLGETSKNTEVFRGFGDYIIFPKNCRLFCDRFLSCFGFPPTSKEGILEHVVTDPVFLVLVAALLGGVIIYAISRSKKEGGAKTTSSSSGNR
jgi:hypothetical protein